MTIVLGIAGYSLGKTHSLDEILAIVRKYDVRYIELWPWNLEGEDKDLPGAADRYEGKNAAKVEALLNKHGVSVACVSNIGAFTKELAEKPDDYLACLKKSIDVAVFLKSKYVNSYCYYFGLGHDAAVESFVDVLKPAADYAAEHGVTLCLENEAHDATGTPGGMLKILEAVNHPALKTTFDPVNYYQAGEEGYPYAYDLLKEHIAFVHIKGGCIYHPALSEKIKGGTMTGHLDQEGAHIYYPPIPEGAINTDRLLERLREDGYDGFVMLEPHVPAEMVEDYYRIEVPYARKRGIH